MNKQTNPNKIHIFFIVSLSWSLMVKDWMNEWKWTRSKIIIKLFKGQKKNIFSTGKRAYCNLLLVVPGAWMNEFSNGEKKRWKNLPWIKGVFEFVWPFCVIKKNKIKQPEKGNCNQFLCVFNQKRISFFCCMLPHNRSLN